MFQNAIDVRPCPLSDLSSPLEEFCNPLQCLQIGLDSVASISINHTETLIKLFGQPSLRDTFIRQDRLYPI